MEIEKKIKRILSDPKTLSIIMFAVLIGSNVIMVLGGGRKTDGTIIDNRLTLFSKTP